MLADKWQGEERLSNRCTRRSASRLIWLKEYLIRGDMHVYIHMRIKLKVKHLTPQPQWEKQRRGKGEPSIQISNS